MIEEEPRELSGERSDDERQRGRKREARGREPEDTPGEPGAEGGSGGSSDTPPGAPKPDSDDSALGDTDQHSDANA